VSERNRIYNRSWTTRCKNVVKKVLQAVESKDASTAVATFNVAQSIIDKAVVKGVMHKNTAARRKKLMSRRLKTLEQGQSV
jgi:small subunit ribosomal protein S20